MSILIKGIDLPKDDIYFLFIAEKGEVGIKTGLNQYVTLNEAEAIQIPRPHGRLIDADKLKANYTDDEDVYTPWLREEIDSAPTILEAEDDQ